MKTILLTVLLLLVPLNCHSSFNGKWQGKKTLDVIDKYGLPAAKMAQGDTEVWQYVHCQGGGAIMPVYGNYYNIPPYCARMLFTIKDDTVIKADKRRN